MVDEYGRGGKGGEERKGNEKKEGGEEEKMSKLYIYAEKMKTGEIESEMRNV